MHHFVIDPATLTLAQAMSGDTGASGRLAAAERQLCEQSGVVGAALLTATAFRLRDEDGLILALRHLLAEVESFEREQATG